MSQLDSLDVLDDESPLDSDPNSRPHSSDVAAGRAEIINRLEHDGEFFIEFFLHEELTSPVPFFHYGEIWPLLTNTAMQRVLLAIPRDHAKTTLSKLAVVWYFLFTNHRFCVYVANTNSRAKDACRDIVGYLQSANFVNTYGKVKMSKESETESIWIFEIPIGPDRVKKCILRAIGGNQSMRGINVDNQRPDIAVVDDLEDDDNTGSPILQQKLDRWVFGAFIKALARRKKIIWLGNMLQKTSLLARLSMRPNWNPVVFGALVKDAETGALTPLWPGRWSIEELIEDFNEYRDLGLIETWMCEMMNMPGHGADGFTQEQVHFQAIPPETEILAAWLVLDPAFGENAGNDNSSITAHILPADGPPMVVEHRTGKFREEAMFEEMYQMGLKWNAWVWGIEAVAAQRILIPFFKILLISKMMNREVEMLPLYAGRGDPKVSRIKTWVALMAAKQYAIYEGAVEIVTQLLGYSMKKKSNDDDLIDSCSYGPQMLNEFEALLISAYENGGVDTAEVQYGTGVSNV